MSRTVQIPKNLSLQINNFLTHQHARCVTHYSDPELIHSIEKNFAWLKQFAELHYQSRIKRAQDLESSEVARSQQLAREYIGLKNHDFFVTCVDGRNMPTVMFSKPPHVGGVLRAPAGIVNGFMEGQQKNSVVIDYDSYVVKQIMSLFRERPGETIYYGLDSHLGCAARGQIHATEGGQQTDGGVRADILSKMMIARGIVLLRNELAEKGEHVAQVIPIFFSFDPSSGGVISGLELHLHDKQVAESGFTQNVLDGLAKEGKIVRTIDLLKDERVVQMLTSVISARSADFRKKYASSLLTNWEAITKSYQNGNGDLFKYIFEKLTKAYEISPLPPLVMRQKAKFLMKNIITRFSIAGADLKWPYDSHQEEMIVITDGGYAPFPDLDAFAVFSHDLGGLLHNIKLTIDLIRNFRREGKIKDPISGTQFSQNNFSSAPVFIVNKCVLRGFKESSWEAISLLNIDSLFAQIDWDSLRVLNWRKSDMEHFIFKSVSQKNVVIEFDDALRFIDGIYELFDRMRIMMKDKHFRQMILHGNIIVFNTLVDRNRMPRYIVPFVI